jgi:uncharacterized protein YndB with AHSA1/START domain
MNTEQTLPAVRRSITVSASPERAFAVFAGSIGSWWPRQYSIGTAELADAVIEPKAGGRWYERGVDGSECDWGQVIAYEPPTRLVLTWQIGADWAYNPDPAQGSEIEVRFVPEGPDSTRVEVEHRHFERHGAGGGDVHKAMDDEAGWNFVLGSFGKTVAE